MNRRTLLKNSLFSGAALVGASQMAFAKGLCELQKTPAQTEGPFYPVVDQVDKDSDLVVVDGAKSSAAGEIILIEGVVQDQFCNPVRNALVEIWQACVTGKYNHPSDENPAQLDPNFQYWGKAVTNAEGFYRFRTIIPGAYPADKNWIRPPHIHFKISRRGYVELITQLYFENEKFNETDLILQRLSKEDQKKVIVRLATNEKTAHPTGIFDINLEKI